MSAVHEEPQIQKGPMLVQAIRVGLYLLVLLMMLVYHFFEVHFYNWQVAKSFYLIASLGLCLNGMSVLYLERLYSSARLLQSSFILDLLLVSGLFYLSELNPSLFFFLYLVVIILNGITLGYRGALIAALVASIGFSVSSLSSPEVKGISYVFIFLLNNVAFFTVAVISGYLNQQLDLFATSLKTQTVSLRLVQKLNELIIDNMPFGLLSIDKGGRILQYNPGAQRIFGIDELEGLVVFQLIKELFQVNIFESSYLRHRHEYKLERGVESLLIGMQVFETSDESVADPTYLVVLEDLTEIRKIEFSLRQSEKMAAVGQLAAGIAHEIRNPLTGISGSIELLSQTSNSDDDKRLIKIILKEIDRLNRLIGEFLDFAKPEKPVVDPVDLVPLVESVLDHLQSDPKMSVQMVQVQRDLDEHAIIRGHIDKLRQVFLNIIINSYQAMQNTTEPQLKVSVKVRGSGAAAIVEVIIKDNGCGMSPATKARMFEAFHTTKPKGTGLGLAITHKILQAHACEIQVESNLGLGTEFILRFPAKRD